MHEPGFHRAPLADMPAPSRALEHPPRRADEPSDATDEPEVACKSRSQLQAYAEIRDYSEQLIATAGELRQRVAVLDAQFPTIEEHSIAAVEKAITQLSATGGVALRVKTDDIELDVVGSVRRLYFAECDARESLTRAVDEARRARADAEAARAQADVANQAEDKFLAVMSHELRTPLNAILGYSELIADGTAGEVTPHQREMLARLQQGGRHLLSLIESILGFTRIRSGLEDVVLEHFALDDLVARAQLFILPLRRQKHLTFDVNLPSTPIVMHSDPRKVLQILINLVSNSVKFSEHGGVSVSAKVTENNSDDDIERVQIDVRDTGAGIAPQHLEKVFGALWQGDQQLARPQGGTGLGLTITRELCHLLGGEISATSTVGEGSTFVVSIPLSTVHKSASASAREALMWQSCEQLVPDS